MFKSILLAIGFLFLGTASVLDIDVKTMDGKSKSLSDYKGQVLLIVNTASECGYTPQYEGLEALNQKYKDKGLRVLGFPCNDFGGQEPGTNADIKSFCEKNYSVSFDLFDKLHAKGPDQHPLYKFLTANATPSGDVKWNFEKFLIGKKGNLIARFRSNITPDSPELVKAIEQALAKK
jgi:glutathione peroxidase